MSQAAPPSRMVADPIEVTNIGLIALLAETTRNV